MGNETMPLTSTPTNPTETLNPPSNTRKPFHIAPKPKASVEVIHKYVVDNFLPFIEHDEDFVHFSRVECVDDRSNKMSLINWPGAGLGMIVTTFTALHQLELDLGTTLRIDSRDVVKIIERRHGLPSLHTDYKHRKITGSSCFAGCGHISGAMTRKGVSSGMKTWLTEEYIPSLLLRGVMPEVYEGEHNAFVVLIIKALDIGVMAFDQKDPTKRAYRFSQGWHKLVATELANLLHRKIITKVAPGITLGPFQKIFINSAKAQFKQTLDHLAPHLPRVYVKRNMTGEIETSLYDPDAQLVSFVG